MLAVAFTVMSTFYVDLLWFREVGLTGVFWTELRTKVALGTVFGMLFFALLYVNLLVTRRLAPPPVRFLTPEQEAVERIRMTIEPYLWWLLPIGATVLALLVGIGVSRQWQVFLLWRNSSDIEFGNPEPLFENDPAFYIFSLPWLKFLQGWLFSSLVGVTFLTAIAHFFWGGIRPQARTWGDRVAPATRAAPLGAARADHARQGVGLLPRPLRPADVETRGGAGGVVHRRERSASRAQLPDHRRGRSARRSSSRTSFASGGRCRSSR